VTPLALELRSGRDRLGLKGPKAAEWLVAQAIALPMAPNTWTHSEGAVADGGFLVARLGTGEFFLEAGAPVPALARLNAGLDGNPQGVYRVLREDWAFLLAGDTAHDVLAQVCNVNFAELALETRHLVMTLMIGVAVLVVPESAAGGARFRIWCDPTFGPYLGESLGVVVVECGGRYTGLSA